MELNKQSTVVATKDQLSSEIGSEVVILNLAGGVYYGLNEVGASIWALLKEPTTVEGICAAITTEYAVEPAQCESDVLTLLADLAERGLIQVLDP